MDEYNNPRYPNVDDLPEWVWDLVDKHDLAERTDCPFAAVIVLLSDAGERLKELAMIAHREQAITATTKRRINECKVMIADAERLYAFSPTEPPSEDVGVGACRILPFPPLAAQP